MFNFKKIKEKRMERYEKYREKWREEIKSIVREAMDEWTSDCEYLTKATDDNKRYYCSKAGCEGVKFTKEKKQELNNSGMKWNNEYDFKPAGQNDNNAVE